MRSATWGTLPSLALRTAKDIGALIRERRRRLGLNQRDLATKVGVSRQWVVEVEHGKPRAELSLVLRALDALGVRLVPDAEKSSSRKSKLSSAGPDIDSIVDRHRLRRPGT